MFLRSSSLSSHLRSKPFLILILININVINIARTMVHKVVRFFLSRHAQSPQNIGAPETHDSLTPMGRDQADHLGARVQQAIGNGAVSCAFSSNMRRAENTLIRAANFFDQANEMPAYSSPEFREKSQAEGLGAFQERVADGIRYLRDQARNMAVEAAAVHDASHKYVVFVGHGLYLQELFRQLAEQGVAFPANVNGQNLGMPDNASMR